MMPDLTLYAAILTEEKWISRIDFIYLVKSHCDCSEERHSRFLKTLYQLNFRQITKGNKGEILIRE